MFISSTKIKARLLNRALSLLFPLDLAKCLGDTFVNADLLGGRLQQTAVWHSWPQTLIFYFIFFLNLKYVHMCTSCVGLHMRAGATEVGRGRQSPWSWSYRWREPLAVGVLKCCAILSALGLPLLSPC